MPVRAVDDKSSDTLVVVSGEGFWTGSSDSPPISTNQHQPARCRLDASEQVVDGGGVADDPRACQVHLDRKLISRVGTTSSRSRCSARQAIREDVDAFLIID